MGLDVLRTVPVWVGRDELLRQLKTEFVEANDGPRPVVLALIGQGGIGKTSLAVKLLEAVGVNVQRAELASRSVYAGVICWKAEEGTSFDEVASDLLSALGVESAEPVQKAEQKIQQIIKGLQQQRYLLLLDNLEVILHPASQPEAGRAVQPELRQLLNALVYRPHQSQVILTSREVPLDLADLRYPNSEPDPLLVRLERLGGVDVAAGAEILNQRQVKDSEADRRWVAERVEGHVFVLTQLAAVAKGRPGYLRQHPQLVTQRAEPILQEQLARQSESARELLKRMCVLRVGIDVRGLTFLRLYEETEESEDAWLWAEDSESDSFRFRMAVEMEEPAELTAAEVQETQELIDRLVDSCLVQCRYDEHKREDVYDLHRLIVEFLQTEYQAELPDLLKRVYSFYRTGKTINNPKTLEDLRPVLEAQHFAFQLGNYDEASNLIQGSLEECLGRWGYWNLLKDLCEQVLPHIDEWDRRWHLREIGIIHRDFGNWKTAENFFQEALALDRQVESKSGVATSLGLLGDIESCRGNWDAAEQLFRQSLQLREELGDRSGIAISIGCLGETELGRGNLDKAEPLLKEALGKMQELGMTWHIAETNYDLAQLKRQRGNSEKAQEYYDTAHQIFTQLGAAKDIEKIEREWQGE